MHPYLTRHRDRLIVLAHPEPMPTRLRRYALLVLRWWYWQMYERHTRLAALCLRRHESVVHGLMLNDEEKP